MLTEGDIKDMCDQLMKYFRDTGWRRGICIELEYILSTKYEEVLQHIRENPGGILSVGQEISFIFDPMIEYLENERRNSGAADALRRQKDFWWKEIGYRIGKRIRKIQIGNVRNGAARAPQPAHVERDTHIAERAPVSPAGHLSIQEAEHGLGVVQRRISELREKLAQNPSVDNYLTNILKRAMIEEYGIQTEIKIHSNHDKIQKDHEVKINRINHTFSGASRFDMIAAAKHKLALVVAEGEKRKHISNLLNKKNYFQHEAAEFMYEPKTDIHGLFDKKTF